MYGDGIVPQHVFHPEPEWFPARPELSFLFPLRVTEPEVLPPTWLRVALVRVPLQSLGGSRGASLRQRCTVTHSLSSIVALPASLRGVLSQIRSGWMIQRGRLGQEECAVDERDPPVRLRMDPLNVGIFSPEPRASFLITYIATPHPASVASFTKIHSLNWTSPNRRWLRPSP